MKIPVSDYIISLIFTLFAIETRSSPFARKYRNTTYARIV